MAWNDGLEEPALSIAGTDNSPLPFRRSQPADADELAVRSEFDEKAPPGFFGHRRAFRNDGTYGKWLLEKPLMIVTANCVSPKCCRRG